MGARFGFLIVENDGPCRIIHVLEACEVGLQLLGLLRLAARVREAPSRKDPRSGSLITNGPMVVAWGGAVPSRTR